MSQLRGFASLQFTVLQRWWWGGKVDVYRFDLGVIIDSVLSEFTTESRFYHHNVKRQKS